MRSGGSAGQGSRGKGSGADFYILCLAVPHAGGESQVFAGLARRFLTGGFR